MATELWHFLQVPLYFICDSLMVYSMRKGRYFLLLIISIKRGFVVELCMYVCMYGGVARVIGAEG